MKYCSSCGNQVVDQAVVCPKCGCPIAPTHNPITDKADVGLCVLSAIIPLFGLIYWLIERHTTPKKAKACGITALIAWGIPVAISLVGVIVYLLGYVLYFLFILLFAIFPYLGAILASIF